MSPMLIAGAVAATIIAGTAVYAWNADRALDRTKKALVTAELQRDQFAKGLTQCRIDIAERNRTLATMTGLPEVRKRLCAIRGAGDPCCTPTGKCEP